MTTTGPRAAADDTALETARDPTVALAARRARRAADRARRRRRRRFAGAALVAAPVLAVGFATVGSGDGGPSRVAPPGDDATAPAGATAAASRPPELPRGGRRLFPDFRVVAFYGAPGNEELGALGIGTPDQAARRLARQAKPYARKTRPVLPALELIATIATAAPGEGDLYRQHLPDRQIRRYLRAARRAKALLILDVQPGRADFVTEVRRLRRWLREPDVGIALDPEWRVGAGQVPGKVIGTVGVREVNATSAWVQDLVERHDLPQKPFVIHQFTPQMVQDKAQIREREGLAIIMNVDGFGDRPNKLAKWREFARDEADFFEGYKLFYREDVGLMSPGDVMRMRPRPDFVVYE